MDEARVRELAAGAGLPLVEAEVAEVAVRLTALLAELDALGGLDLPGPDDSFAATTE